jgi:hypothetical protein
VKIGINLVGVSYNDGTFGRYRNYKDAINEFFEHIVNPLKEENHEISFYLCTYDNVKIEELEKDYPSKNIVIAPSTYNYLGGGDKINGNYKTISSLYIASLEQLQNENLDLVISTRFDIKFLKNPFKEYNFDFNKFNFLWREPEYINLPIVNDTFVVFPYDMLDKVIDSIHEMETNPPHGVNVAMHNWYLPMCNQVGSGKVQWVEEEFINTITNKLYVLTRHG